MLLPEHVSSKVVRDAPRLKIFPLACQHLRIISKCPSMIYRVLYPLTSAYLSGFISYQTPHFTPLSSTLPRYPVTCCLCLSGNFQPLEVSKSKESISCGALIAHHIQANGEILLIMAIIANSYWTLALSYKMFSVFYRCPFFFFFFVIV